MKEEFIRVRVFRASGRPKAVEEFELFEVWDSNLDKVEDSQFATESLVLEWQFESPDISLVNQEIAVWRARREHRKTLCLRTENGILKRDIFRTAKLDKEPNTPA